MGIVTQDAILFNDTVANNLSLGRPHATEEEMTEVAKIANAHDFIMALPEGYQTNIGDGGGKLSGGKTAFVHRPCHFEKPSYFSVG